MGRPRDIPGPRKDRRLTMGVGSPWPRPITSTVYSKSQVSNSAQSNPKEVNESQGGLRSRYEIPVFLQARA